MAKRAKTTATETAANGDTTTVAAGNTAYTDTPAQALTLKYDTWEITADRLGFEPDYVIPAKAVYVLSNGFNQSMTDAAAMTKEQKAKVLEGVDEADHESVLDEYARGRRQKRFEAILNGTIGARVGGARLPTIERTMRTIAEERLIARAAAKKIKLPVKAKDTILVGGVAKTRAELIDGILAKDADGIRVEAQARLDANKAAVDIGSDDLI